jgi:uncharacterized protein YkvS
MRLEDVKPGDAVLITAKGEFFAFVDGWRGKVTGLNNGLVTVECVRVDGTKTLFVPADELTLSV